MSLPLRFTCSGNYIFRSRIEENIYRVFPPFSIRIRSRFRSRMNEVPIRGAGSGGGLN